MTKIGQRCAGWRRHRVGCLRQKSRASRLKRVIGLDAQKDVQTWVALVSVWRGQRRVFRRALFARPATFDLDVSLRAQAKLPSRRRFRTREDEKQHQERPERKS